MATSKPSDADADAASVLAPVPAPGEIRSLGLLKGTPESKHIKTSKYLPYVGGDSIV